jgi:alkylhydroperoxidase family enzyme
LLPWIDVIPLKNAKGALRREYEAALKRAGRIWHIVSIMSQNPRTMKSSMELYSAVLIGRSPLSRSQREMLAIVVSSANHCVY